MKYSRTAGIVLTVLIVTFGIIYLVIEDKKLDEVASEINRQYPSLKKQESISGVVTDIFYPSGFKRNPFSVIIELDGVRKVGTHSNCESEQYIDEIIANGCRIDIRILRYSLRFFMMMPNLKEYCFLLSGE